jgi:hypothetical protein
VFRAPLFLILALLALTPFGRVAGAAPTPRWLALTICCAVLRAGTLAFLSQYAQFASTLMPPSGDRARPRPSVGGVVFVSPRSPRSRRRWAACSPTASGHGGHCASGPRRGDRAAAVAAVSGRRRLRFWASRWPPWVSGPASSVPNLALMMAAFPPAQQGAAGGLAFLGRTLGSAVGVQATALLFDARLPRDGFLAAFHAAFLAAGLVCLLAAGLALLPARPAGPRGGR